MQLFPNEKGRIDEPFIERLMKEVWFDINILQLYNGVMKDVGSEGMEELLAESIIEMQRRRIKLQEEEMIKAAQEEYRLRKSSKAAKVSSKQMKLPNIDGKDGSNDGPSSKEGRDKGVRGSKDSQTSRRNSGGGLPGMSSSGQVLALPPSHGGPKARERRNSFIKSVVKAAAMTTDSAVGQQSSGPAAASGGAAPSRKSTAGGSPPKTAAKMRGAVSQIGRLNTQLDDGSGGGAGGKNGPGMTAADAKELEKLDLYAVFRKTIQMETLCSGTSINKCYLTFTEFLTMISKFSAADLVVPPLYKKFVLRDFQLIDALFCCFDLDESQTVEPDELFTLIRAIDPFITRDLNNFLFNKYDVDGSECLEFAEFVYCMNDLFLNMEGIRDLTIE